MQDLNTANHLFQHGQYQQAYNLYRQIYKKVKASRKNSAIVLAQMAQCQHRMNNLKDAELYYKKSLKANSAQPRIQFSLGALYLATNEIGKAKVCFTRVTDQQNENAYAHANLGYIYRLEGDRNRSLKHFQIAAKIKPDSAEIQYNSGLTYLSLSMINKSEEAFNNALALKPDYAEGISGLGMCSHKRNDYAGAIKYFKQALSINSRCFDALKGMGFVLLITRSPNKAIRYFQPAMEITPTDLELQCGLGQAYFQLGQLKKAKDQYERVLQKNKKHIHAHKGLAELYRSLGEYQKAERHYRSALDLDSTQRTLISDYLLLLNYSDTLDRQYVFDQHILYNKSSVTSKGSITERHRPAANNRPRIGYLSPDFRDHVVSRFFLPVIKHHSERVETYCYSITRNPDSITEVIKSNADHWRDVSRLSDNEIVNSIRADNIDLLVDLSGHTHNNRLSVFFSHPARYQAAYLGYPNTTGLAEIEYRITDTIADANDAEQYHSESLLRLDGCFLCYEPVESYPAVKESPCLKNADVTFGCFNNLTKITDGSLGLWARLLAEIPAARLMIKNLAFKHEEYRAHFRNRLTDIGIDGSRYQLVPPDDGYREHLDMYNGVDISLDTFPYNGTTTTFESLLMGVPVLTMVGLSHNSRVGASILKNLGYGSLVAESEIEFISIAKKLANDRQLLADYKQNLRPALLNSSLCDGKRFTEKLEHAYMNILIR